MRLHTIAERDHVRNIAAEVGLNLTGAMPGGQLVRAVTREDTPREVVLKYGDRVNPHEIPLHKMVLQQGWSLNFRVPPLVGSDQYLPRGPYLVTEVINGIRADVLLGKAENYADVAYLLCRIGSEYQQLIHVYGERENLLRINHRLELAKMCGKVVKWQFEAGVLTRAELFQAFKLVSKLDSRNAGNLFGYAHGDVHPQHVFTSKAPSDPRPYLTDLNLVVRPGGLGLYDQIRALDSLLVHGSHHETWYQTVLDQIAILCKRYDPPTVHGLMAHRLVGALRDCVLDAKAKKITHEQCADRIASGKKMMQYCLARS